MEAVLGKTVLTQQHVDLKVVLKCFGGTYLALDPSLSL